MRSRGRAPESGLRNLRSVFPELKKDSSDQVLEETVHADLLESDQWGKVVLTAALAEVC